MCLKDTLRQGLKRAFVAQRPSKKLDQPWHVRSIRGPFLHMPMEFPNGPLLQTIPNYNLSSLTKREKHKMILWFLCLLVSPDPQPRGHRERESSLQRKALGLVRVPHGQRGTRQKRVALKLTLHLLMYFY